MECNKTKFKMLFNDGDEIALEFTSSSFLANNNLIISELPFSIAA